jgi:hypothetical protein
VIGAASSSTVEYQTTDAATLCQMAKSNTSFAAVKVCQVIERWLDRLPGKTFKTCHPSINGSTSTAALACAGTASVSTIT